MVQAGLYKKLATREKVQIVNELIILIFLSRISELRLIVTERDNIRERDW